MEGQLLAYTEYHNAIHDCNL